MIKKAEGQSWKDYIGATEWKEQIKQYLFKISG